MSKIDILSRVASCRSRVLISLGKETHVRRFARLRSADSPYGRPDSTGVNPWVDVRQPSSYAGIWSKATKRHKLLSGETIGLEDVEARDIAFLKNLQRMAASEEIGFFEIERVAIGPGSPALQGWSRVTRDIVSSPLYRVAADIATRAGIAEGLVLAPEHEDKRKQIPVDRSLMSVTQAANTLGISRAAVHKAIQQRRLAAQWYGNVILVSREAVLRYKQGRADGRRPSHSEARTPSKTSSKSLLVAKSHERAG